MADWLGWNGLLPNEQMAALAGGVLFGGGVLAVETMFGGLHLPRRKPKPKKKRKAGKGRR